MADTTEAANGVTIQQYFDDFFARSVPLRDGIVGGYGNNYGHKLYYVAGRPGEADEPHALDAGAESGIPSGRRLLEAAREAAPALVARELAPPEAAGMRDL